MKRNKNCKRCLLHKSALQNACVWGRGNPNADLLLCGESPGVEEDIAGVPFVGQAGKLLNHILNKLGIDRADVYVTNVLKCHPKQNKLPKKSELVKCFEQCKPYLDQEIKGVKPKAIVLMGSTALNLVTGLSGITRYECMEVQTVWENIYIYAAFHPAYVLRKPGVEVRLAQAIARAAKAAGMKVKTKGWETGGIFNYEIRS